MSSSEEQQQQQQESVDNNNVKTERSVVTLQDEPSIVKIQSIGRRKLARRKVALQRELQNEKQAEVDNYRKQPIEMPVDDLEVAAASVKQDVEVEASSLRHPVHPFNKADPSKFQVTGQDQVAGGMQRVYRRMLQSKTWW